MSITIGGVPTAEEVDGTADVSDVMNALPEPVRSAVYELGTGATLGLGQLPVVS